ncbi:MAG: antibiotic biosynthesis monooxygenase [Gammaproteobacteria bacterium]|nr:antibiotic biosynthesis monooxygenase [Gammaproteobacteria bacterium]
MLIAPAGGEAALGYAARARIAALDDDPGLVYADLHATKHAGKLVLIEMYRDVGAHQAAAAHGRGWAAWCREHLAPDSVTERIRPLLSDPPARARPVADGSAVPAAPLRCLVGADCRPFGAFVRVYPKPECEPEFIPILRRQGELMTAGEPGYVYADFYRFDAPGDWLVVEYYDDRRSLSHHHTLAHTLAFAERKARAGYERRKHEAFTLRPIASVGPWARRFVTAVC